MSHWIETPAISDRLTGKDVFRFKNPNWSLDSAEWLGHSTVVLSLRKYPGNHRPTSVAATVDCLAGTAAIDGKSVPSLRELERALDSALTWSDSGSRKGAPVTESSDFSGECR